MTALVNEFAGSILEITGGTGIGQTRRVTSNTATVLTVSPAFATTPDATSDFEIMPEQIYGATNGVTSVAVTETGVSSKQKTMFIGSSNGADGGGVTVFQGYGTNYVADVYHSDAGKVSDAGVAWSGTDADDVTAIGALNGSTVMAAGSLQHLWVEKIDQYLEQSIDLLSNNLLLIQNELLQDGLLGTSPEAGFLGGADLAEYYNSYETLESGTVVGVDASMADSVKRSSEPYQRDLIGVVATRPGIILGSGHETTYPIALVGRVPVNISTENGPIKAGDRVTSGTLEGYGMRATKAGRVLGVAIEDAVVPENGFCPDDPEGANEKRCGQVMVFVNLVDYNGASLTMLMEEARAGLDFGTEETPVATCVDTEGNATSTDATGSCSEGYTLSEPEQIESQGLVVGRDREKAIISYLKAVKLESPEGDLESEIFTDRVAAAFEVFSPNIITEGLRTDHISALEDNILFKDDVIFFGTPYFTTDTAGFAMIKTGDSEVTVTFDKEYLEKPIVNASMATSDGLEATVNSAEIQAFFGKDIRFLIANASTTGFTIFLNKPAEENITFNWIALAVKGAKTFESATTTPQSILVPPPTPEPVPDPVPTPEPAPDPTPEPTPDPLPPPTPEPVSDPVPTPDPVPEPIPEPTPEPEPTPTPEPPPEPPPVEPSPTP
jgi:hypothetical protein